MDLVYDNVYIGNQASANSERLLLSYRIGTVISLLMPDERDPSTVSLYHKLRVKCFNFDVDDDPTTNISKHFKECKQIIKRFACEKRTGRPNVLVHCHGGVSRSASILIAYGILNNDWTFLESYYHVHEARGAIYPNDGFIDQLRDLASCNAHPLS